MLTLVLAWRAPVPVKEPVKTAPERLEKVLL